ncbi:MAG: hypothetical protein K2M17_03105 [Bacilli bacterium]|nr:hypothetical protein [Bacilli bacterium]
MQDFLNYIIDHYVTFLTISIVLIFALIGYFVDIKRRKADPYQARQMDNISLENLPNSDNATISGAINSNAAVMAAPIDRASSTVNMASGGTQQIDNNQNGVQ